MAKFEFYSVETLQSQVLYGQLISRIHYKRVKIEQCGCDIKRTKYYIFPMSCQ